jgi:hypothetical protein
MTTFAQPASPLMRIKFILTILFGKNKIIKVTVCIMNIRLKT